MKSRRRRWFALAVSFVLYAGCGGSAAPAAKPTQPKAADAKTPAPAAVAVKAPSPRGPFLYRLEGKTGPVYLFGTIHMEVSAKDDLDPVVWSSFTSCKQLVLEIDPTSIDQMALIGRAMIKDGPNLEQQLGPELWTKLTKLVKVPPAMLTKMKPWLAAMLLQVVGVDPSKSMELEFLGYAKEHGITLGQLETADDQIAAIEKTSDLDDLKEAIGDYDKNVKNLRDVVDAYRTGDLDRFIELFQDDMDGDGSDDPILKDRNTKWVPEIETYLEGGNVFIAVGAGHLFGDDGLLAQLAAKGHNAVRVPPSKPAAQAPAPKAAQVIWAAFAGLRRAG